MRRSPTITVVKNAYQTICLRDQSTGIRHVLYLGRIGEPAVTPRYNRIVGEWIATGRVLRELLDDERREMCVAELIEAYIRERVPELTPAHARPVQSYLRRLRDYAGDRAVSSVGPNLIRSIRRSLMTGEDAFGRPMSQAWGRGWTEAVKALFAWGVGRELVPPAVRDAIRAVEGWSGGRKTERVATVDLAVVEATRPYLSAEAALLVDLQLLTAARPGELLGLTADAIDRSGNVWKASLLHHKNAWKGKDRTLYFGPKAQSMLAPLLLSRPAGRLFTYTGPQYYIHVRRAAEKAKQPHWHPNQLRHTAATMIRAKYGLEASSLILGHASATMTDAVYAERDAARIHEVITGVG